MFGDLLSSVIKIVTLPVDATAAAIDIITDGDGSKKSREDIPIIGDIAKLRDEVADTAKKIDEE